MAALGHIILPTRINLSLGSEASRWRSYPWIRRPSDRSSACRRAGHLGFGHHELPQKKVMRGSGCTAIEPFVSVCSRMSSCSAAQKGVFGESPVMRTKRAKKSQRKGHHEERPRSPLEKPEGSQGNEEINKMRSEPFGDICVSERAQTPPDMRGLHFAFRKPCRRRPGRSWL